MLQILMIIFGLVGLIKGEFQLTRNRRMINPHGRIAGLILLASAFVLPLIGLIIAIIYGFATSQKVEKTKTKVKNEDAL